MSQVQILSSRLLKIKRLDQKPDLFFIVAIKVLLRFLGNLMHQILMAILNSFGIISFNQLYNYNTTVP